VAVAVAVAVWSNVCVEFCDKVAIFAEMIERNYSHK